MKVYVFDTQVAPIVGSLEIGGYDPAGLGWQIRTDVSLPLVGADLSDEPYSRVKDLAVRSVDGRLGVEIALVQSHNAEDGFSPVADKKPMFAERQLTHDEEEAWFGSFIGEETMYQDISLHAFAHLGMDLIVTGDGTVIASDQVYSTTTMCPPYSHEPEWRELLVQKFRGCVDE